MFGTVVDSIVEDGQQQVLFVYFRGSLDTCLEHGQLKDIACFLVKHEVGGVDGQTDLVFSHTHLQLGLHRLEVQVQTTE